MFFPYFFVVLFLVSTVESNVGQEINGFFNNLGKGIENWASDVADDVRSWSMNFGDLEMTKRAEDDAAIASYKRGEINDEQLRTRLYINQYEYNQAVNDRIKQQMNKRI